MYFNDLSYYLYSILDRKMAEGNYFYFLDIVM